MSEYPENAWIWDDPMNGGRGWDTEDRGCSKKYLRADTCTPNEECVSKAELRELLNDWQVRASLVPSLRLASAIKDCIRELREVMK